MKRREFIAGLGSAAAWPLVARAQQAERVRRIGVLMAFVESDPEGKAYLSVFTAGACRVGLEQRPQPADGRSLGRRQRRPGARVRERVGRPAPRRNPLANGTVATAALQRETRTIPIVFAPVSDPVGAGFVASLPRPGGNITGFINMEAGMASKWLELLTEIAPGIKRAAIMFNPDTAPGGGSYYLPAFEAAARSLKVAPITAPVRSDAEIETVITSLGREPGGGLVLMPDSFY